jgi:phosphoserine phosphatase RsbU/P
LPDGRWGILIADVSGHGTAAAVLMAITHSIAHTYPGSPVPASRMLTFLNQKLASRYTTDSGTFVTAFYGIYDPQGRTLNYASAGHNPPRLKGCADGAVQSLEGAANLPLGISEDEAFTEFTQRLVPGDRILFYTDGITEAQNAVGEQFGLARLDRVLAGCHSASDLIAAVLAAVEDFTGGRAADDDRTLLVARVQ